MKKLLPMLMLCLLIPLFFMPLRSAGAAESPPVSTLLTEAETGMILHEGNADMQRPVGSLAKLMTAHLTALAIENGSFTPETVLTAGNAVSGVKGAVIWLEPGDTISVSELLTGLLAGNANDAATVLAEAVSGDIQTFVDDMNAAAFDLGMKHTRFTSPQGYDDPAACSTARDMGLLARAVLSHEVLRPHLTVWHTFIRDESVEIVNENTLTRTYEGCLGLKAAHSEAAGQCLIAAAEKDGMQCIAVVLGCEDEDTRFRLAKSLLNDGFSGYQITVPGFSEEFLMPLAVKKGTQSAVRIAPAFLPPLAVSRSAGDCETVMVLPEYVTAPLVKGQQVGTVHFYQGDTLLCSVPLLAADEAERIGFGYALSKMLRFLWK